MGRVNADVATDLGCRYLSRKSVDEDFDLTTCRWDKALSRVDGDLFEALREVRSPESFGCWGVESRKYLDLISDPRGKMSYVLMVRIETYRLQCNIDQCWVVEIPVFNLISEPGRCCRGNAINSAHRVEPLEQIFIL